MRRAKAYRSSDSVV